MGETALKKKESANKQANKINKKESARTEKQQQLEETRVPG